MVFRESALAHRLLDGLYGIEIGGSAHNLFGLNSLNVDLTSDPSTVFKQRETELCGRALPVDIVAPGDELPLDSSSVDFVISSHVLEHFPDPIKALKEWWRVIRPGGYIFAIVPHKERTFDKERPRTALAELIQRHKTGEGPNPDLAHCSVWITEDIVELVRYLDYPICAVQDIDDKVGNGFAVALQKPLWNSLPGPITRLLARILRLVRRLRVSVAACETPTEAMTRIRARSTQLSPPPSPLCPFFNGQVKGTVDKLHLRFPNGIPFGFFANMGSNWIYHVDLGDEYVAPGNDTANSIYMWDLKTTHWLYASPAAFPYLYDFTLNAWLYYFPDTHNPGHYTANPRYFANMTTGQIFSM
jgi:SAM-dependent methyltransferase